MLARTASNLYWMGRYVERAENTARVLDVAWRMSLLVREPSLRDREWFAPLNITGNSGVQDAGVSLPLAAALTLLAGGLAGGLKGACVFTNRAIPVRVQGRIRLLRPNSGMIAFTRSNEVSPLRPEHRQVGEPRHHVDPSGAQYAGRESGAIAVLIAETGGQNALIADSSALPDHRVISLDLRGRGSGMGIGGLDRDRPAWRRGRRAARAGSARGA